MGVGRKCPGAGAAGGVCVWGADPANTGTATKAGITMAAPSNKGLV